MQYNLVFTTELNIITQSLGAYPKVQKHFQRYLKLVKGLYTPQTAVYHWSIYAMHIWQLNSGASKDALLDSILDNDDLTLLIRLLAIDASYHDMINRDGYFQDLHVSLDTDRLDYEVNLLSLTLLSEN